MNEREEVGGEEEQQQRTRKQIFKDLMRYRTTRNQGLTLRQIFFEVYSDFIEETKHIPSLTEKNITTNQIYDSLLDDRSYYAKIRYLKKMIKQVKKTDNDFKWLSVLPVKINNVDPMTGDKIGRSYIEHRYINVKPSITPELLRQINEIWQKRIRKRYDTIHTRTYILKHHFEEKTIREEKEARERKNSKVRFDSIDS
jgi:hypothetical protein